MQVSEQPQLRRWLSTFGNRLPDGRQSIAKPSKPDTFETFLDVIPPEIGMFPSEDWARAFSGLRGKHGDGAHRIVTAIVNGIDMVG